MTDDFTKIWKKILGIRLVVPALILIAIGLAAYYPYLGYRYWSAQSNIVSLYRLLPTYRQTNTTNLQDLKRDLADQKELREQSNKIFDYSDTDLLTFLAKDAISKARVEIRSVAVGEIQNQIVDSLEFDVRPITITLRGQTSEIDRAIRFLNQHLSVGAVKRITLTDLDSLPTARIEFVFYLSPNPSEDDSADQS
ncbi:MAG: hypothetical protein IIC24_01365 [Chloroflexi bacterium]|nr:hypothetical protein [Chloroflexota bacterium]MCH8308901.1 hypothetical protein [Chloroflexota bacterium]